MTLDMPSSNEIPDHCQASPKAAANAVPSPGQARSIASGMTRSRRRMRRAISTKGGEARSNRARARKALPADPLTNEEVHAWLGLAFKAVIGGRMAPGVGSAAATIAKTMMELTREVELEQRIVALEQAYERKRA